MHDRPLPRKANGVLPITTSQTAGNTQSSNTAKSGKTKTPVEGDKILIRRLPPGLSEEEFWNILGHQWKPGKGLVDWCDFRAGKTSQDPAKTSKPARVYLHVKRRESLAELSEIVQTRSWEDSKLTYNNPCLIGPPVLEFSIYKKIPGSKKRTDPRQGTIDQDPEFMAFLQSLTNPELEKETASNDDKTASVTEENKSETKVTTTPLIEYLKEKKANKAKEAAAAKTSKHTRQESQGTKSKSATDDAKKPRKEKEKEKESKASKGAEKPKATVKILTKKEKATVEAAKAAETAATQLNTGAQEAPKSRRANIAAAARILQRDLGLSPGSAHRRARLNAAKSEGEAKPASSPTTEPSAAATSAGTATAAATSGASTTSSGAPGANTASSNQPADRPTTPTTTKSGRSRRGGGGKNSNNTSEAKVKNPDPTTAGSTAPPPAKGPVVLFKKKDKSQAPATEQTTSTSNSPSTAKASGAQNGSKTSSGRATGGGKKSSATVSHGATRGFVKHANPSQGITEAALRQALEPFGAITLIETDRRKGFAYVDFAEHQGLVKAVAASPVPVGQGAVQVMERKEKKVNTGGSAASPAASAPPAASSTSASAQKPEQSTSRRHRRGRGGGGGDKNARPAADSGSQQDTGAVLSQPGTKAG